MHGRGRQQLLRRADRSISTRSSTTGCASPARTVPRDRRPPRPSCPTSRSPGATPGCAVGRPGATPRLRPARRASASPRSRSVTRRSSSSTRPPFDFNGQTWTSFGVDSNGYLVVGGDGSEDNNCCNLPAGPDPARPNNVLAPFWTDLDGTGRRRHPRRGPDRRRRRLDRRRVAGQRLRHDDRTVLPDLDRDTTTPAPRQDITYAYDPALPTDPRIDFLVGAENQLGQGDMVAVLPTGDLRVTCTDAVPGDSVTYTVDVTGNRVGGAGSPPDDGRLVPGTTIVKTDIRVPQKLTSARPRSRIGPSRGRSELPNRRVATGVLAQEQRVAAVVLVAAAVGLEYDERAVDEHLHVLHAWLGAAEAAVTPRHGASVDDVTGRTDAERPARSATAATTSCSVGSIGVPGIVGGTAVVRGVSGVVATDNDGAVVEGGVPAMTSTAVLSSAARRCRSRSAPYCPPYPHRRRRRRSRG